VSNGALELFREACGSSTRLKLEILGPGGESGRQFELERPFALIGRDRRADIRIDAAAVSPRHVFVQVIAGLPFFVDLGSRSGTLWQGQPRKDGWLTESGALGLGAWTVRLRLDRLNAATDVAAGVPAGDPLQADAAEQPHSPILSLELAGAPSEWPRRRLDRVLSLVGRAPACAIRLGDRSVSPFHCALLRTGQGLWIVDLLGKGGVWVNGRQMRWARLEDESRVQVGCFTFRVRYPRPTYRPSVDQFLEAQSIGELRAADGRRPDELPAESQETAPVGGAPQLVSAAPELSAPFPLPGGLVSPASYPLVSPRSPFDGASLPVLTMQHFAVFQQQMLAQFQQGMLMMAQMMSAWRHEEMELLREVLERLGRLKQRVARSASERKKQVARRKQKADGKRATGSPTNTPREIPAHGLDPSSLPEASSSNGAAAAPAPIPAENLDPNFHAWLSGRIAALDKDRQGVWRKFLAMLLGK